MTSNEYLILAETFLLLVITVVAIYSVKKEKGNINTNDLLAIFVDNKELLITIVNQLGNIKTNNVPMNILRASVITAINTVLLSDDNKQLTDFQKKLIENNKDFFVDYIADRVTTKETLAGNLDERVEKNK